MIYIACLPKFATGGTELLNQFGAELMARGVDVRMLYHGAEGDPVAPRFKKYAVPYVTDIASPGADDVIVVPEVLTDLLYEWPGMRKVIWWLSIDFYFRSFWSKRNLRRRWLQRKRFYRFDDPQVMHFVQSDYARGYLTGRNVAVTGDLSDYLGDDFIASAAQGANAQRQPIVVYNPKKGIAFTRKLMALAPDVTFRAIENMTPVEVAALLQSAAVYIDFGNHPGKDRIPREAAISGCIVVVGKRGSANSSIDVPIDPMFKFDTDKAGLAATAELLRRAVRDPQAYIPMFDGYRAMISGEKKIFQHQVDDFIGHMG